MIPLVEPTHPQHWDLPDIESPASSHPSLPPKQKQPIREIPTWRRWLVVLGAFLALFCTFGQLSAFGTFLSWYSNNQLSSYSPSEISWIGSLQLWVFFFSVSTLIIYDAIVKILRYSIRGQSWGAPLTVMAHDHYLSSVLRSTYQVL